MRYHIDSIEALIEHFGGPTALGQRLGITQEAVSNWALRNSIGAGWHLRLLVELRQSGATVNPRVFGLDDVICPTIFGRQAA